MFDNRDVSLFTLYEYLIYIRYREYNFQKMKLTELKTERFFR